MKSKRLHEYTDEELRLATELDVRMDDDHVETTDEELSRIVLCENLKKFSVDGSAVTDAGMSFVGQVTSIEELFVTCPKLTDACFVDLAQMLNLVDLTLQCAPGVTGAEFGQLRRLPIRELCVAQCAITDSSLSLLKSWPALTRLNIAGPAITNNGLTVLKELPKLQTLFLAGPNINDDSVPYIKELTQVRFLYLFRSISDVGKAHIQIALPHCCIR